jgi:hypothetical protein
MEILPGEVEPSERMNVMSLQKNRMVDQITDGSIKRVKPDQSGLSSTENDLSLPCNTIADFNKS